MPLTKEQLLDAVDQVEKQGRLSIDDKGRCLYQHPQEGVNCVIGKLLTPEQRVLGDTDKHDSSISSLNLKYGWFSDVEVLQDLQSLHDTAYDLESFVSSAKELIDERYN